MEGNKKCSCSGGRLCVCALGGAIGISWALAVLVLSVIAKAGKVGVVWVTTLSSIYIGYALTPKGIVIGVVWALVDGIITGVLIAWIYNMISACCKCYKCCKKCDPSTEVNKV